MLGPRSPLKKMGRTKEETTEIYLKNFENKTLD